MNDNNDFSFMSYSNVEMPNIFSSCILYLPLQGDTRNYAINRDYSALDTFTTRSFNNNDGEGFYTTFERKFMNNKFCARMNNISTIAVNAELITGENEITISFLVNKETNKSFVIMRGDSCYYGSNAVSIVINANNTLDITFCSVYSTNIDISSFYNENEWNHFVITYSSYIRPYDSLIKVYINNTYIYICRIN